MSQGYRALESHSESYIQSQSPVECKMPQYEKNVQPDWDKTQDLWNTWFISLNSYTNLKLVMLATKLPLY
jgi:hypothetical protein